MIIGTAGHVDHGKTTLVRAITGVDTDRLKEEKARGISIELGYAYQAVDGAGETLGFIDVPGHERFIHTMLAGVSGIDFALLVVAADDGVMPQTREHVAILDLLGVDRGAVAITKCDRVDAGRLAQVEAEVAALLAATALAGSLLFPVCASTGEGVAALTAHLHAAARCPGRRRLGRRFRLAVDRSFTLAGIGTVVSGTVFAGEARLGETLMLSPMGREVRLRSLHAQNRPAEIGRAGQRCALNLVGVAKDDIFRGDWILDPRLHAPTQRLDVRLRLLPDAARPLRHWSPIQLHLAACRVGGRVALLEAEMLAPGDSGLAQLVLDRPIGALHGDRFILRDAAANATLGGGRVLDPFAAARHRRSPERLTLLAAMDAADPAPALAQLLAQAPTGVDLAAFCRAFNLGTDELAPLLAEARRVRDGDSDIGFSASHWQALRDRLLAGLASFHAQYPDELGPDPARLRRILSPQLPAAAWAALLAELLAEERIARSGPWLHLPGHSLRLSAAEEALAGRLLPLLEAGAFDPPWVRELAARLGETEAAVRQLLLRLARRGDVFQVVRDLFYHRAAVGRLARLAADLDHEDGAVRAARFRDATGLGRKRAIQVLEFFDRVGYTRRARDEHRLRSDTLLTLE